MSGGGGGVGTAPCGVGSDGADGGGTGNDVFSSVPGKDDNIASAEGGDIDIRCDVAFGTERTTLFVKTQIWSNMSVYKRIGVVRHNKLYYI